MAEVRSSPQNASLEGGGHESSESAPRVDLTCVHFSSELLETIPREVAEHHKVLPVYLRKGRKKKKAPAEPGVLYVAMSDVADQSALEDCALCCNMTVRPLLADRKALEEAIPIVYSGGALNRPQPPPPRPPPPVAPRPPPVVTRSVSTPELPLIRPTGASAPPVSFRDEQPTRPDLTIEVPPRSGVAARGEAPRSEPAHSEPAHSEPARSKPVRSEPMPSEPARVLVVGGMPGLEEACREAVAPLGGVVESREMGRAGQIDDVERPHLVVVSEEIYPFDRRAFNLLAMRLGAPLIVWSFDMDASDLQALLMAALSPAIPPMRPSDVPPSSPS